MIEPGIDRELVAWIRSFFTHRKIQIVINGHKNEEKKIETEIPQGLPVSPILFLIYISGVLASVSESCSLITFLLFVDGFGFIASGSLFKNIALILKKVATTVLQWCKANAVTYDIA